MSEVNYKNKYMALRSKYMGDLDMAFRLGFEQGQQQAQNDQAAQAQAEQQQMEQLQAQAAGGGQPGQEAATGQEQPGEQAPDAVNGQVSELDKHIAELESMIAKSEELSKDAEIKKSLDNLKAIRKNELQKIELKKSALAIKGIAKALHKPAFKMGVQASHNLSNNAKQAVTLQHKIVSDVMAKMEAEEKRASADIKSLLSIEGLTKKE